jgi:hypothetical protein
MRFLVVVKVDLSMPYELWQVAYDEGQGARRATGVRDIFRHPVLGEQAALYAVETCEPRTVHDFVYDPRHRPAIEASGFVVGSERITICEIED